MLGVQGGYRQDEAELSIAVLLEDIFGGPASKASSAENGRPAPVSEGLERCGNIARHHRWARRRDRQRRGSSQTHLATAEADKGGVDDSSGEAHPCNGVGI